MELAGEETLHSDDFYLELDGIKMSARSLKSYGNEAQLNVVMKLRCEKNHRQDEEERKDFAYRQDIVRKRVQHSMSHQHKCDI